MGAPSNLADQDHHVIRLTRIEDVLEEMSADLLLSASDWEVPNLSPSDLSEIARVNI